MTQTTCFILEESQISHAWYNIAADLPSVLAPILNTIAKQSVVADGYWRY